MRSKDKYCFSKASHILYVGWLLKFSRAVDIVMAASLALCAVSLVWPH